MEPQKAKYGEQMKAWALDRALEFWKAQRFVDNYTDSHVVGTAEKFAAWVCEPQEDLDTPADETEGEESVQ